jgi:hypothetical protein
MSIKGRVIADPAFFNISSNYDKELRLTGEMGFNLPLDSVHSRSIKQVGLSADHHRFLSQFDSPGQGGDYRIQFLRRKVKRRALYPVGCIFLLKVRNPPFW